MSIIDRVTLETMKKNRTRTVVTIIGVILSAAMITAVTTFISSMQSLMVRSEIATAGSWQAAITDISYSSASSIAKNSELSKAGITRIDGCALLQGAKDPDAPYLCIREFDANAMNLYNLNLTAGRLPEKAGELVITEDLKADDGLDYAVGDQLTLAVGKRVGADGKEIKWSEPHTESEKIAADAASKTYTIVGIAKRPSFESYSTPFCSAITLLDSSSLSADETTSVVYTAKNAGNIKKLSASLAGQAGIKADSVTYHKDLLNYMGLSPNDSFNSVVYSMAAILILLIMIGSISLIYNAFAISVSERSRQFGMLAGVGATSRQIRNGVFFEAGVISAIGIPLGIIAGIGGIGVTLYLLRGIFDSFTNIGVPFQLSVSVIAVVAAAVIGFATVLISAWIPSRRAARVSPIEAIRQTGDVKIKGKQVKTSRLSQALLGMEGTLALKNFKRNRRRYRATVISLFISILLFVSASSFTNYMQKGTEAAYMDVNYDVTVRAGSPKLDADTQKLFSSIEKLDTVKSFSVIRSMYGTYSADSSLVRSSLIKGKKPDITLNKDGTVPLTYRLCAIDDGEFRRFVKANGLSLTEYTDTDNPKAILMDAQEYYDQSGKLQVNHLFQNKPKSVSLGYEVPEKDQVDKRTLSALAVGASVTGTPLGMESYNFSAGSFTLFVSDSVYNTLTKNVPDDAFQHCVLSLTSSDPKQLSTAITTVISNSKATGISVYNLAEALSKTRSFILVINVFAYGFIILITLITVANVFNTISTNVNLRRREFAMLKSVGMTPRGFNKMMNIECIFYGLKALLYGLPASAFFTWLIYLAIIHGVGMAYMLPWNSILISIIGVFLIVFITMMYSMQKVKKENIVDALKNENL